MSWVLHNGDAFRRLFRRHTPNGRKRPGLKKTLSPNTSPKPPCVLGRFVVREGTK